MFQALHQALFRLPPDFQQGREPARVLPSNMDESTKKPARKGGSALSKPVQPDEKLASIVGSDPLPRTAITKRMWDYIKEHKLQDTENKQRINADEKLKEIFDGRDQVTMFEMTKLISGHIR